MSGDNIIVRFIRSRRSQVRDLQMTELMPYSAAGEKSLLLDHCSFSWSIDEIASFYDNRDFTMQWCALGEGLANPGHTKGLAKLCGGMWGGKGMRRSIIIL